MPDALRRSPSRCSDSMVTTTARLAHEAVACLKCDGADVAIARIKHQLGV